MAVTLERYEQRSVRTAIFYVRVNGEVFPLRRVDFTIPENPTAEDLQELRDWAAPIVQKILAARAASEEEEAAIVAAVKDSPAAFNAWLVANRLRPDVYPRLLELGRIYVREVG